jgi:hypothetical protein
MCFKNAIIFVFLLFTTNLFSQILVDDVGDGWKSQVDSALLLIKKTSPEHWTEVENYCTHITFWLGNFSTTSDSSTVMISTKDIRLNSINNLACIIIHETHHLYILNKGIKLTEPKEELECYLYELKFVNKLKDCEFWLKAHVIKCINHYSEE